MYLLLELFSCADEHRNLVNLSDGGHIDSLGVYELLRRRCRVVIASDATADPEHSFSDLVQLLRMARIDLGVHITDLQLDPLIPSTETGLSKNHVVAGKILYPVGTDKYEEGTFIYVKSGLIVRDPYDLLSYRREHPEFPQESTVDQFFDETQLESYRELGYQSGRELRDLVRNRAIAGLAS